MQEKVPLDIGILKTRDDNPNLKIRFPSKFLDQESESVIQIADSDC